MVFVKSQNVYVDYILGLKSFKVRKLVDMLEEEEGLGKGNSLEVFCCEYREVEGENYLGNF
jgi:hypothetical protein